MDRFANNIPMEKPKKREYDERDLWFHNLYERSHQKPFQIVFGGNKHHGKIKDYYQVEKPTFKNIAQNKQIKNYFQLDYFVYRDKKDTFVPEQSKSTIRVGKTVNTTVNSNYKPTIYSSQRVTVTIKDKPIKTYIKQK